MIEQILSVFEKNGYTWKFSDGVRAPNEEDLTKTLETMKDALAEAEENTQVELGRLIVKKSEGHYDVYVYVGEL